MKSKPSPTRRLSVERLEDRTVPAPLAVTTIADGGLGSLRQAILDSNSSVGVLDTITFDIGSGTQTIALLSALPTITDPVVIDGTTQAGFAGAPLIVLNGAGAGASADGLTVTAGNTTVRGLVINAFGGQGIELRTGGNNRIVGNYIGTNAGGTAAVAFGAPDGSGHGVYVLSSSNNVIGGTSVADRNLISGVRGDGIAIAGIDSKLNVIQGNYVGTNAAGTAAVSNYGHGVSLLGTDSDDNLIGGTAQGAGNLLSGSTNGNGIGVMSTTASGNLIQGNRIGTNFNGTLSISNTRGVLIHGPNNIVGGSDPTTRNVISGNRGGGVEILSTADGTVVRGNYIGATSTGGALGNADGVSVFQADDTAIVGNLIRSNASIGVYIARAARTTISDNDIRHNTLGGVYLRAEGGTVSDTLFSGNVVYGNGNYGIQVRAEGGVVDDTTIRNNRISANEKIGIWLVGYNGTLTGTVIQGNLVGTDATGTTAEGNGQYGIYLANSSGTLVGGTNPADRNVISGNGQGLLIIGVEQPSSNNTVQGNYIGVDVTGTRPLGNTGGGLEIFQNAQRNLIGGTATGAGNVIGGNGTYGVAIAGMTLQGSATENVVSGNFIGTDVSGTRDLRNGTHGVVLTSKAANNTIGGSAAGAGNVIAFNGASGIFAGKASAGSFQPLTGNAFLSNAIYSNSGLGIDLGEDNGVTLNNSFGHVGPNNYQNYPLLSGAYSAGGTLTVSGTLSSTPNTPFTIQFFASDAADASGFGEGQRYLGSITVTTGPTGSASFSANFGTGFALGNAVSATATDAAGNTSEFAEAVTVVRGNEPPVLTVPGTGPTVAEEGTTAVSGVSVSDPDAGTGEVLLTASVPTAAGVLSATAAGATVSGTGTSVVTIRGPLAAVNATLATLAFTGATNFQGSAALTLVADDQGNAGPGGPRTATKAVAIAVTAVNDEPSLSFAAPSATVNEDGGAFGPTSFATFFPGGGPDESGQTALSYAVSSNNTALFGVQPALDASGRLTFTPAANAVGTATVSVTVRDSGGTSNDGDDTSQTFTFTINVNGVNDEPSLSFASPTVTVNEDTGAFSQAFATLIPGGGSDESTQTALSYAVGITNGSLFSSGPSIAPNGTLTFTPAANAFGSATVSVVVTDSGGTANGGDNTSQTFTFTINVTPVADTPGITNADAVANTQTTGGLVVTRNPADGAEVTHVRVTNITSGTLFLSNGTTPVGEGAFVPFDQAGLGFKFTPAPGFTGDAGFDVQASTSDQDSGLGGAVAHATVAVGPQLFTPSVTSASTPEDLTSTGGLVITANASDGGATQFFRITGIAGGTLFQNNGTTVIPEGAFITVAQGNAGLKFLPAANLNGLTTAFFGFDAEGSTTNTAAGVGGNKARAAVAVTPVNDEPSANFASPTVTVNEDSGAFSQTSFATLIPGSGPDESAQTALSYAMSNNNTALFSAQPAIDPSGRLTFTPAPNAFGSAIVTVRVTDSGGTANGGDNTSQLLTFTITVTPLADALSATNATTNEDTQTTGGLVVTRNAADGAEVTHVKVTNVQHGTVFLGTGTAVAAGAFITIDQVGAGLKFTPDADFFGTASFQVQGSLSATDSGLSGSPTTAIVTVKPVADTPTATSAATAEDAQTTAGLVITPNALDGTSATHFKVTGIRGGRLFLADGTTEVTEGSFLTAAQAAAGLRFTPGADLNDTGAEFGFSAQASTSDSDSGLGGAVVPITITVDPVNDAPDTVLPGAVVVQGGAFVRPNFATFIAGGGSDESGQSARRYSVTADNPALFSVAPAIAPDGTLTFTPAPGATGTATLTVTVADDGGTGNGGADTSAARQFTISVTAPPPAPVAAPPSAPPAVPYYTNALVIGNLLVLQGSGVPGGTAVLPVPPGWNALFTDANGDGKGDVVLLLPNLIAVLDGATGRFSALLTGLNTPSPQFLLFNPDGTTTRVI